MPCSLQNVSSLTRAWTQALWAVKGQKSNHWLTREFPGWFLYNTEKFGHWKKKFWSFRWVMHYLHSQCIWQNWSHGLALLHSGWEIKNTYGYVCEVIIRVKNSLHWSDLYWKFICGNKKKLKIVRKNCFMSFKTNVKSLHNENLKWFPNYKPFSLTFR